MERKLEIITAIIKFSAQVDTYEIRGIKDTDWKLWACYIAHKYTDCHPRQIADYFQIYRPYMEHRLEDMAIFFLVDPEALETLEEIARLFTEIDAVKL